MSPDSERLPYRRHVFYNPMLDARNQTVKMTDAMRAAVLSGEYDDGSAVRGGPLHTTQGYDLSPNLVSSHCRDGLHRPALDYDDVTSEEAAIAHASECWECVADDVIVVPSTSNFHVYIPTVAFGTIEYLTRLYEDPEIDDRYAAASEARGQSLLRLPWIEKLS